MAILRPCRVQLQFSIRVFGALLLLLGISRAFWKENPWVGLGMTVFVAFALLVLFRVRRIAVVASANEREANAKMYGFIEERLAGLEDLRSLGAGKHTLFRFQEVSRLYFDPVHPGPVWPCGHLADHVGPCLRWALLRHSPLVWGCTSPV